MIKLNSNKSKEIKFDVSISGTKSSNISGALRFIIDNIEYGFPIEIKNNSFYVRIPPLNEILNIEKVKEKEFSAKLEVIADNIFIKPWQDKIMIEDPTNVEVSLVEEVEENIEKPVINIETVIEEEQKEPKKEKPIKEEKIEKKEEPKKEKTKFGKFLVDF
jgi:hypothetical protein